MEDIEEAVVAIHINDLDKFEGQSKWSTGWFNIDHEFKKGKFSTLEPEFYKNICEKDIEGLEMERYKCF